MLQFSETSGQKVLFNADLVRGLDSQGLRGQLTAQEALRKLLSGTGLVPRKTGSGSVTLEKANTVEPQSATTLAPVNVTGKAVYDSTDPYNTDYNRPNATTATKTDTPIMETPFSVQVIPKQVMQDQQAVRLERAIENVSGTYSSRASGGFGGQSATFVRGFETFEFYRDGGKFNGGFVVNGPREMANVERVEVLKGPASILFGRMEPGGMVNIVTKRPLDTPYYSLQQQFGSFDFYRTTADATGPVTDDKSLLYRVNLAYENSGSFREFLEHDRVFFAPTFHWTISDQTQANFHMEYQHSKDPHDMGLFAIGNRPVNLPRERNLGEKGQWDESETFNVGFDWSHAFNDNWTLRHRFDAIFLPKANTLPTVNVNGPVNPSNCTPAGCRVNRGIFRDERDDHNYYTTLDMLGKFSTWGIKHEVLIGGDYQRLDHSTDFFFTPYLQIDAYNPQHTGLDLNAGRFGGSINNPFNFGHNAFTEEWGGFYTQDQIELPYHVHLLAGFRYDTARFTESQTFSSSGDQTNTYSNTEQEAVNPRFGILYQPIPEVSVYGNYVENFGSTNGINANGIALPATTAQQFEAGIKTELFDKRLSTTLAWFDITKQNIAVTDPDPDNALRGFQTAVGEVRNQGIELDVAGEVLPGWNVIGSYSYIDSQITKDTGQDVNGNITLGNQGHRLFNVPRNIASLWNTYEFLGGDLRGLKFGGGVLVRDQREGDNSNTFQLPGYATINLLASYTLNIGKTKFTAQLNIDNLLNKNYYDSASNSTGNGIYPGAPRTVLGSIRLEF
ncbi:TonB-dependent receptor [Methylomonas montana]|uniref:TonB-dependent siderophore receptor n=1 Tax=Methylomonas montana TaxID=3058963 RepID=UPI00265950F2|nr:TonB-dependent receptor [Methylomonas montana]WKJ90303.1 TonB-dependent receptor [Methylomonas montana]